MNDCCRLEARSCQLSVCGLARTKDLLKDEGPALLAGADLVNQNLRANVLELLTGTRGPSCLGESRRCALRVAAVKLTKHVFSVLVYAVEEQVLQLCLVRESAGLHVSHFLYLLLLLVKLCLHSHNLILLVLIEGSEELHDLHSNGDWF